MAGGDQLQRSATTGAVPRLALPVRQAFGVSEQAGLVRRQLQACGAQTDAASIECGLQSVDAGGIVQHQHEVGSLVGDAQQARRCVVEQLFALVRVEPAQGLAILPHEILLQERLARRVQQQIARFGGASLFSDPGRLVAPLGDTVEDQAQSGEGVRARQLGPIHGNDPLRWRTRSRSRRWSWHSGC